MGEKAGVEQFKCKLCVVQAAGWLLGESIGLPLLAKVLPFCMLEAKEMGFAPLEQLGKDFGL